MLFDSSLYQFECDDDVNSAASSDDVRMNACAVVYETDRDFGNLETIPTKLTQPECHVPPSSKIRLEDLNHLTKSQRTELLDLLNCHVTLSAFQMYQVILI